MSKLFFIAVLVLSFLAIAGVGCANNQASDKALLKNPNLEGKNNATSTERVPMGEPGSITDLQVGKKVLVWGTLGTDGTVSASRIMVGNVGSWENDNRFDHASSTNGQTPPSVNGVRPQWNGNGNNANRQRNGVSGFHLGRSGSTMVSGEILKQDSSSLVLKIDNGGSKIVFFTDKTSIFLPKITTSTAK